MSMTSPFYLMSRKGKDRYIKEPLEQENSFGGGYGYTKEPGVTEISFNGELKCRGGKVANEDIGKIIGKQGRTVQAIRTILGAASAKMKKRSSLEIIE